MSFLLAPALPGFRIEAVEAMNNEYLIRAQATVPTAACPDCAQASAAVHSWYERRPRDLPSCGLAVRLCLQVRRFFCHNRDCARKVFCERLPHLLAVSARRTVRLAQTLVLLAFHLGGQAGTRVVGHLGMPASRDTLLRLIRRQPVLAAQAPRVIGVDDWALRKGHHYGTIICDLEAGEVIDLLPDREAATLAEWLKQQPTIEVITRDRSRAYAEGATIGAPQARQVADRWHLLRNLVEAVEAILAQHPQHLIRRMPAQTEAKEQAAFVRDEALALSGSPSAKQESERQTKRQARLDQYNHLQQLRAKGLILRDIAKQVGISERTANHWVANGAFPERKRRARQPSLLDAYLSYLDRRWAEGCHKAAQLWRELRQQGFTGSYSLVYSYAWRRRHDLPVYTRSTWSAVSAGVETRRQRYSPRQAAVLFVRQADQLAATEQDDLAAMFHDCPLLATTYALAQQFGDMIRRRDVTALNGWLTAVQTSRIVELVQFAAGLERDRAEVEAALTTHWSNGPVEGHVNRLKVIKRQMYGRANLDLLRRRVLYRG